jgi:hypothetical protein
VVDEAGMVGSRQMERVLSAADAGAKVVLVGDPEQLQAIEAGGAFRAVAERVGSVEITAVRRQREGWQQEATKNWRPGGRRRRWTVTRRPGWCMGMTRWRRRGRRGGGVEPPGRPRRMSRSCWRIGGWMCRR